MAHKTVVVTGANRGLGLEIVKQLATAASTTAAANNKGTDGTSTPLASSSGVSNLVVYALCRTTSDALLELKAATGPHTIHIVEDIDVTQDAVVSKLQSVFAPARTNDDDDDPIIGIDLLIHNSGAYGPPETFQTANEMYQSQNLENITMDRMRYAFELNTLGPLKVTKALLPNLLHANNGNNKVNDDDDANSNNKDCVSKVIIISSLMGSVADNDSGGHYGYRSAKAAVNMVGKSLAMDLAKDKIAVGLIHPGYVYTGFQGSHTEKQPGQYDVQPATRGVLEAIDAITMDTTGSFLHGNYGEGVKHLSW